MAADIYSYVLPRSRPDHVFRTGCPRASLLGRVVERRSNVCCHHLDAAGMVGTGMGAAGGGLAVIRFGTFNYWANSYFGGAVAAIGGALVLGALPRMKQQKRVLHALLMGLGFAILANSRPYEGLFFGIPVAGALIFWLWKMERPELVIALRRVIVPLLAVIIVTIISMGYYFWRTTGSPFKTPYLVDLHTQEPIPYFFWQRLQPLPTHSWPQFVALYRKHFLPLYKSAQTSVGAVSMSLIETLYFWSFFLGPVFTLPFVLAWGTLPIGFRWRNISGGTRFLLLVCVITLMGEALPLWYSPHYTAPITCALIALLLIAMRRVRPWHWHSRAVGIPIIRAIPSVCVALLVLRIGTSTIGWPPPSKRAVALTPLWCTLSPMNWNRAAVLKRLRRYPGRQLVFVHYNLDHDNSNFDLNFNEWVFNRADLNTAKVIWARDMGLEKNEELIKYFKHCHAWLVDADDNPPKLVSYPELGRGS